MSVSAPLPLTGTPQPIVTGQSASSTTSSNKLGSDDFLKLLVAQMQYQDPMNPADSTQLMAQTAQFQMVQSLNTISTSDNQLLTAQQLMGASSLVGKQVTYAGADGKDVTGTVTGARFDDPSGPMLTVGGKDVLMSAVKGVSAPTTG